MEMSAGNQLAECMEEIDRLKERIAYYEQENARLEEENETLHNTAWQVIRRLRELEAQS